MNTLHEFLIIFVILDIGLLLFLTLSLFEEARGVSKNMPIASITDPTQRFDLKSLPGGFVVIRRMTWGEKLKRQSMMTKFYMNIGDKKSEGTSAEVDFLQEKVSQWEFSNLIVEHNLEVKEFGGNIRLLNFKNQADIAQLDPVIGEEIQKRIDELNSFEEDEEVKN